MPAYLLTGSWMVFECLSRSVAFVAEEQEEEVSWVMRETMAWQTYLVDATRRETVAIVLLVVVHYHRPKCW